MNLFPNATIRMKRDTLINSIRQLTSLQTEIDSATAALDKARDELFDATATKEAACQRKQPALSRLEELGALSGSLKDAMTKSEERLEKLEKEMPRAEAKVAASEDALGALQIEPSVLLQLQRLENSCKQANYEMYSVSSGGFLSSNVKTHG